MPRGFKVPPVGAFVLLGALLLGAAAYKAWSAPTEEIDLSDYVIVPRGLAESQLASKLDVDLVTGWVCGTTSTHHLYGYCSEEGIVPKIRAIRWSSAADNCALVPDLVRLAGYDWETWGQKPPLDILPAPTLSNETPLVGAVMQGLSDSSGVPLAEILNAHNLGRGASKDEYYPAARNSPVWALHGKDLLLTCFPPAGWRSYSEKAAWYRHWEQWAWGQPWTALIHREVRTDPSGDAAWKEFAKQRNCIDDQWGIWTYPPVGRPFDVEAALKHDLDENLWFCHLYNCFIFASLELLWRPHDLFPLWAMCPHGSEQKNDLEKIRDTVGRHKEYTTASGLPVSVQAAAPAILGLSKTLMSGSSAGALGAFVQSAVNIANSIEAQQAVWQNRKMDWWSTSWEPVLFPKARLCTEERLFLPSYFERRSLGG